MIKLIDTRNGEIRTEEKTREEGLEEVVEHHKAGDAAVTSLNKYLDENRKKMEPTSEETQVLSSIIEENEISVLSIFILLPPRLQPRALD